MSIWDDTELWKSKGPTKEDVHQQQKLDAESVDSDAGHWVDAISGAVSHIAPDTIGFLGDLGYDVSRFVYNAAKQGMHSDPQKNLEGLKIPGEGPVGRKAVEIHDRIIGEDVTPRSRTERMVTAGVRGAADMAPFAVGAPASAILSGLTGGLSAQGASEAFPNNHWLPLVAGIIGGGIPALAHPVFTARANKAISQGMEHSSFAELLPVVIGIEGGGTLAHPRFSPKGAMGVMQVMPETAAHPGFGIKPWDRKSQADLARVGRDYLAVLTRKYDGDHTKVLAAYNAGPGKVDSLTRRFGENWAKHLPEETKEYLEHGLQKLVDGHLNGPEGPDGIQTNGSVRPIPSEDLAKILPNQDILSENIASEGPKLTDHEVAMGYRLDEDGNLVHPDNPVYGDDLRAPKDNIVEFPQADKPQELPQDVLTPAEQQEMDASAEKPIVDNTGYEANTPYIDEPSVPANDIEGKSSLDIEIENRLNTPENLAKAKEVWNAAHEEHMSKFLQPDDYNSAIIKQKGGTGRKFNMTKDDFQAAIDHADEAVKKYWQEKVDGIKDAIGGGQEPPSGGGDEPPSSGDGEGPQGPTPLTPEELFTKVSDALKKAVPARAKQKELYSQERSKRVKEVSQVRQVTGGVEGFHAEKAKLRGELPVADYSGLTGLGEQDIHALFDHVKNHPNLGYLQSINAREGLAKMLQGRAPTSSEIALLARTMPPELLKQLRGSKSLLAKIADGTANVLNVPKALMASFDISAPMRQGVLMIGRKEFYKAFVPMVRALVSPKYQEAVFENIYRDPLFSAMQDSDLAVPVYKQHNGGPALMDHEEPYMTNLAQRIPLVGIGIRASERAYNTFVYKLRADTFKSLYNAGKAQGKSWDHDSLKDLSKFINTFTGRGDLGRFNNMAPILNSALFSPKLLKSRIDSLNPAFYAKLDPFVRKEAIKSMMTFALFATTTMGLAKLAGAEVGLDPRQADGWKIKVGNTRYDILGGEQQLVRLMGNVSTYAVSNAKELIKTGKITTGFADKTAIDSIGQFFRNKESPDVSLGHDFMAGRDAVGQDFRSDHSILSRVSPMVGQDIFDAYADLKSAGVPVDKSILMGTLKASPSLIGVGATTYPPYEKKGKAVDPFNDTSLWGDQKDVFNDPKVWGN